jgi:hypothetical protein
LAKVFKFARRRSIRLAVVLLGVSPEPDQQFGDGQVFALDRELLVIGQPLGHKPMEFLPALGRAVGAEVKPLATQLDKSAVELLGFLTTVGRGFAHGAASEV